MLPLLVWLAGCVFGFWCIWHWGFYREALAFAVCLSVLLWVVGGASWLGRKLQEHARKQTTPVPPDPTPAQLSPEEVAQLAKLTRTEQGNTTT